METIGKYRWKICALLFFATTINYLDRQVIGLLKPVLEKEFDWSETKTVLIRTTWDYFDRYEEWQNWLGD